MSENKTEKFRIRLTDEQKRIVLEHPYAGGYIRSFIQNQINKGNPCNEVLNCDHVFMITPTMKKQIEGMTNISQHVRAFIDTILKTDVNK